MKQWTGKARYSVADKSRKYRAEVKSAPKNADSISYKRGYVSALDDVKREYRFVARPAAPSSAGGEGKAPLL
jgi:hypothetical protein